MLLTVVVDQMEPMVVEAGRMVTPFARADQTQVLLMADQTLLSSVAAAAAELLARKGK